ncbi:MAG: hypothetical protein ABIO43_04835 [Sphingomicrobium sp.]
MRFLTRAEYPLVALVLFSLAGKAALNRQDEDHTILEPPFVLAVQRELSQAGFTSNVEQWPTGVAIQAQGGACRIWVRESTPHGTMRNVYDELAKPLGKLRFVYREAISEDPPKLDPMLRFFFNREMARLGVKVSRSPIYAVASSSACDIHSIQWPVTIGRPPDLPPRA